MSVHSRGFFKRHKRLSFISPASDDRETEVEVTDERFRPITDHGKGITNDRYAKSDSAHPKVQASPRPSSKA